MIARFGEAVTRCRPAGATVRTARHLRLDPPFPLQLKELLTDCLARELKLIRQTGDRGRSLPLQGGQNRAAALGQLINGDDGKLLGW
jgi:hypothetical protein